ncbi:endothelial lipase isoform X2 [Hemicordylus capensis]|uniref:endothelial lipase isoform X2 n=1 Tax=Hemicordylus capensis TaxID=884348 RepID=UPI0023024E5A|nr:endothelial lipase isoform X2 [Hemicordylus capensis]XP_053151784.1 endothelial lipase isoform X2 [Hemicordylus capensis]XP_053151785.1 endothelial lipase isoform X2 [Hemicordylus capensis]XP_053151786.1 endothelial lipase isoform X2 [Hemicordylus capensis]XP_053151787.1 endothelial lipase isoform X2 [Hemicordylus capensis]XP_053151788.1 endothelial lipase isoform X2 [Hemicordylus capensis]
MTLSSQYLLYITDASISQLLKPDKEPSNPQKLQVKFNVRTSTDPEDKGCYLTIGQDQYLDDCKFNVSAKSFFIIHGWTLSGMFERWLGSLVSALQEREKDANVVVVDWLALAHQLYTDAVNNTRVVGKEVAKLLDWLQEKELFQLQNVHLIGYSLGAHVAGYTGNYAHGTIGRITGLDPAGPMFEGADPNKRLSPDDADFVDVLHTYTRETLGISIGIQMPVGHIDIYPNGGDFQPGCGLSDVLGALAYGNIGDVVRCEHERSVHLFVDSLVNKDKQSFAFQCTDSSRFKKGICLSCRKNRCNSIGYNAKKMRNKRNSKMYLKTRAGMPFKVYHYQMKMHVFSYKNMGETEPTFSVTLQGTNGDSQPLPLEVFEQIGLNYTNTFLVYTEEDVGDVLKIRLTWEGSSQTWYSLWRELKSYWSLPENSSKELQIRRIRVKSGETQQKLTFCAEDPQMMNISPGRDLWFVKCREGWQMKNQTRSASSLH